MATEGASPFARAMRSSQFIYNLGIDKLGIIWYNIYRKKEMRYIIMTILDKAIQRFGFEDARTITIAVLEEQGKNKLAEELWEALTEEDDE